MKLIKWLNATQNFVDNNFDSCSHSIIMFFICLLLIAAMIGAIAVYIIVYPTIKTACIFGGLIVARVVYAGFTGK